VCMVSDFPVYVQNLLGPERISGPVDAQATVAELVAACSSSPQFLLPELLEWRN